LATHALIPGAGGDPWEWHWLVSELASRGQEATAVRLPADDDTAGWSDYAAAVVDAIGDRIDVILVAASMGGFTAPIVCTRRRIDRTSASIQWQTTRETSRKGSLAGTPISTSQIRMR
jgi:hypothetical protein